jgi:hypothetical protein
MALLLRKGVIDPPSQRPVALAIALTLKNGQTFRSMISGLWA